MYSDPVQKEYSQIANRYDSRWSFYVNTTIQKTLDRLEIAPKERILDLHSLSPKLCFPMF